MTSLVIEHISKSFGNNSVLNDVSVSCNKGEIVGVFGRNGTGKSSLLKMIFGTMRYDQGEIMIDNKVYSQSEIIRKQKIAYLPQDSFLPKDKKVRSIIPFFFPQGEDQDRIFYAEGIGDFTEKKIRQLSIGQLRYLEILIIGNLNHGFLLLDEPFSMIEPIFKEHIKKFLLKIRAHKGIMITDHYFEDVLDLTDSNYLLKDAGIIAIDNKQALIENGYLNKL